MERFNNLHEAGELGSNRDGVWIQISDTQALPPNGGRIGSVHARVAVRANSAATTH